ncbi:MAG: glycosyltransferase [Acetobacteraceae bacterium]|nr:glycosyltransferase [Acetobacteraceae bacterium]
MLKMVDVLLPNSRLELSAIERDFPSVTVAGHPVPNAAAAAFKDASPEPFVSRNGLKDFVLCVARIDNRKNQLALIEAMKNEPYTVVFIGGQSPHHGSYYRAFLAKVRGSPRLRHLGQLPSETVASAYKAAAVHVLPSWLETPGLSSLEAALAGCRVVTTDRGSPREYFGDLAWYCDPRDPESIRRAVLDALASPVPPQLAELVERKYSWEQAARETLKGYELAIARRAHRADDEPVGD